MDVENLWRQILYWRKVVLVALLHDSSNRAGILCKYFKSYDQAFILFFCHIVPLPEQIGQVP
jgi:hypothetical protein